MKKQHFSLLVLVLFLAAGCIRKPSAPVTLADFTKGSSIDSRLLGLWHAYDIDCKKFVTSGPSLIRTFHFKPGHVFFYNEKYVAKAEELQDSNFFYTYNGILVKTYSPDDLTSFDKYRYEIISEEETGNTLLRITPLDYGRHWEYFIKSKNQTPKNNS